MAKLYPKLSFAAMMKREQGTNSSPPMQVQQFKPLQLVQDGQRDPSCKSTKARKRGQADPTGECAKKTKRELVQLGDVLPRDLIDLITAHLGRKSHILAATCTEFRNICHSVLCAALLDEVQRRLLVGDSIGDAMCSCPYFALPAGLTSIGDYVFEFCISLTAIKLPAGLTFIGSCAFNGCTSLTTITLPAAVTSIGSYAFNGCTSLTTITLPAALTKIGSCLLYTSPSPRDS